MLARSKKLGMVMFAALALVLALTASTAPAGATTQGASRGGAATAPAVADDDVGSMALAPPCNRVSTRSDFWGNYVDVRNLCGNAYRVKVIIAFGPDSACHHLDPGDGFTHAHFSGRFDRLDLC